MARYAPLTYDSALTVARTTSKPARASLLRRIYDAIVEARLRQAEHEVARFLATRGKFTDAVEREIERRLSTRTS
jgi:hypothetical protein